MEYSIEPIFVVFPLVCLLVGIVKKNSQGILAYIAIIAFILFYSCSLNGADYQAYSDYYDAFRAGYGIKDIHGEIAFNYLMSLAAKSGMNYQVFRMILLSIISIVLFNTIRRISSNFLLSVYFLTTMFLVYTVSSYRQYIVMAFSIYWIYQYCQGKRRVAVIGLAVLLLFHITVIIPLALLLFYDLVSEKRKNKIFAFIIRNIFSIILIFFAVRIVLYFAMKTILSSYIISILGVYASEGLTLITFGLISRVTFFILIAYLYRILCPVDTISKILFWCYSIGILIYIMIPLELFMGRLMNSISIFSIILIPLLVYKDIDYELIPNATVVYNNKKIVLSMLVVVAFAILINQLTKQNGYTPYINYFFS